MSDVDRIVSSLRHALETKNATITATLLREALAPLDPSLNEALVGLLTKYLPRDTESVAPASVEAEEKCLSPDTGASAFDAADSVKERVEAAVAAIRAGKFVVVADGEDRENEGDLIIAAEKITPQDVAFMVNETSGLICVGVIGARLDELRLPLMVQDNTESHGTAFTVSVDYKTGTTTGISASDRAATIRALADPSVQATDFCRPGHVFPLRYRDGGVLVRPGHTEASVDLPRLAGLYPAGALCEIVNRDGSMARPGRCRAFAREHGLRFITIADLVEYRRSHEPLA